MIDEKFPYAFAISNKVLDLGKLWKTAASNIVTLTTSPSKIQYKNKIAIAKTLDLQIKGQLQYRGGTILLVIYALKLDEVLKLNFHQMKDLCHQANSSQNPSLLYKIDNNCFCLQYCFKEYELQSTKFMRRFQETSDSFKKMIREYRREKKDFSRNSQMLYLKYVIEKRRRTRNNHSDCNLMEQKLQLEENAHLLGTTKLRKQKGSKQYYDFQKKTVMEINFDHLYESVQKNNRFVNCGEPILRSIDFINTSLKSRMIDQGGMGTVRRIKSRYLIKGSVHDAVNQQMQAQNSPYNIQQKEEISDLVEKKCLPGKNEQISFNIEKKFLLTYKNHKCGHIASYFIESSQKPDLSTQIYSTFYPFSVQDYIQKHHSSNELLGIIEQLCRGVHFMFENRIIHRDLKLGNLRLDKNGLLKMIDFGSVAPVEGERPSWYPENTCFCGTKQYYLNYNLLPGPLKKMYSQKMFYRHQLFDIYSLGVIFHKLLQFSPSPCDSSDSGMFRYLQEKCKEQNPSDRMDPLQILTFINIIKKSSLLSPQFRTFLESFQ